MRHADLLEIGPEWGLFDYVIAHGLFSWVPEAVREKILAIAGEHLALHGVAYVSDDTYPGGRLREAVPEMMLYHTRHAPDAATRVRMARGPVEALCEGLSRQDPYRAFLAAVIERIAARPDACLYHDQLAEIYQPVYFHELVARAERHGLQYLGEADFSDVRLPEMPAGAARMLETATDDPLVAEQYRDFLRCRCFRRTLLCRRETPVDRAVAPERLRGLYVASAFAPAQAPHLQPRIPVELHGPRRRKVTSDHPLTKATLAVLAQYWPAALPFHDLLREVQGALGQAQADASSLAEVLVQASAADVVELHAWAAPMAARPGERPQASALARWQAAGGIEVTTLRHTAVRLESDRERRLLELLDGTRDRGALLREQDLAELSAGQLEAALRSLARIGLLVC
ncbi:MAG: methyltransferase regulatory domain-containing protein [Bryobacteraceae bacterium]